MLEITLKKKPDFFLRKEKSNADHRKREGRPFWGRHLRFRSFCVNALERFVLLFFFFLLLIKREGGFLESNIRCRKMDSQNSEMGIQEVPSTPFFVCKNPTVSQDSGLVPSLPSQHLTASQAVNSSSVSVPEILNSSGESIYHGSIPGSSQADQRVPCGSFNSHSSQLLTPNDPILHARKQSPRPSTSSIASSRRSAEQKRRIAQMSEKPLDECRVGRLTSLPPNDQMQHVRKHSPLPTTSSTPSSRRSAEQQRRVAQMSEKVKLAGNVIGAIFD